MVIAFKILKQSTAIRIRHSRVYISLHLVNISSPLPIFCVLYKYYIMSFVTVYKVSPQLCCNKHVLSSRPVLCAFIFWTWCWMCSLVSDVYVCPTPGVHRCATFVTMRRKIQHSVACVRWLGLTQAASYKISSSFVMLLLLGWTQRVTWRRCFTR